MASAWKYFQMPQAQWYPSFLLSVYRTSPTRLLTARTKRVYGRSHSGGNISICGGMSLNKWRTYTHTLSLFLVSDSSLKNPPKYNFSDFRAGKILQVKQEAWYSVDSLESQDVGTDSRWVARTPISHQGHTGYLTFARKTL